MCPTRQCYSVVSFHLLFDFPKHDKNYSDYFRKRGKNQSPSIPILYEYFIIENYIFHFEPFSLFYILSRQGGSSR